MSEPRRVIIVGRARGALAEYAAARAMAHFDEIIVVGKMGEVFPDEIDYWASFHSNLFDRWAARRAANNLAPAGHYWGGIYNGKRIGAGQVKCEPITWVSTSGGSSGFLALEGALSILRAERIVLAGIPMDAEASHEPEASEAGEDGPWREAHLYWATWEARMGQLRGRVRSMSGRTRAALGAPTSDWLRE